MSMFSRDPEAPTVEEPRRRRRRFWLLLVGLPLLAVVVVAVGWIASANSGLQGVMAELDATDPNWRLADLEASRYTPPPGQNAAERVVTITKLLPNGWQMGQPRNAQQPADPRQYEILDNLRPQEQLNEPQITAVQAILQTAGPQALAQARTLIDTPRGRHALQYSPDWVGTLLKCQDNREVASLLRYDALERAQAGDLAGAAAACHALFHTGCSIGDEPFLISQLVRLAVQAVAVNALERVLAQGEPPADRLAALQARLEAEEPAPLLLYGARGERAGGNHLFEYLRSNPGSASGLFGLMRAGGGGGPDLTALLMYVPGYVTTQHTGYLRFLTELVETAKRPPEEWGAVFTNQQATMQQLPFLVRMLVPAMQKVSEAVVRNHAMLRSAIVALAAERFRQKNGQWPASPDELVQAGLLKAVPTDPHDGKPIRLARTADGLVVYCVGPDQVDNGGTRDPQNPVKAGTDLVFRLWDVKARRQPAPPPKPATPGADNPDGPPPDGPPPPGAPSTPPQER